MNQAMVKFVYNSACSPYVAKDVAMPIAEEVFYTILRYVSAHTVSVLVRGASKNPLKKEVKKS